MICRLSAPELRNSTCCVHGMLTSTRNRNSTARSSSEITSVTPVDEATGTFTEAQARQNFAAWQRVVVAGDPQITQPPGRARGAMLRAYDKKNGTQVG